MYCGIATGGSESEQKNSNDSRSAELKLEGSTRTVPFVIPATYHPRTVNYRPGAKIFDISFDVAYPSMEPWSKVGPRSPFEKKVSLRVSSTGYHTPQKSLSIYLSAFPKSPPKLMGDLGLINWSGDKPGFQVFTPAVDRPTVYLMCGYRGPSVKAELGCRTELLANLTSNNIGTTRSHKTAAVHIRYEATRQLLPEWQDVERKTIELLQKFTN